MAKSLSRRLSAQIIDDDIDAFLSLKVVATYQPANAAYSVAATAAGLDKLRAREEAELHAYNAFAAARDATVAAQQEFHELILGVKTQMKAQFGENSDEVASLGLKKKSEHRSRAKTTKTERPESP